MAHHSSYLAIREQHIQVSRIINTVTPQQEGKQVSTTHHSWNVAAGTPLNTAVALICNKVMAADRGSSGPHTSTLAVDRGSPGPHTNTLAAGRDSSGPHMSTVAPCTHCRNNHNHGLDGKDTVGVLGIHHGLNYSDGSESESTGGLILNFSFFASCLASSSLLVRMTSATGTHPGSGGSSSNLFGMSSVFFHGLVLSSSITAAGRAVWESLGDRTVDKTLKAPTLSSTNKEAVVVVNLNLEQ
ncbi:hypothetical protein E2C01_011346 [Portunus trituberculatus]|uniref:Uncharacterized protein n=1 Tax=Portunus trituberculatus TaxID=210409 RepID=A0A5B7DB59_PORTR|nr:hypothetical protein [Portunus trituberculatus]